MAIFRHSQGFSKGRYVVSIMAQGSSFVPTLAHNAALACVNCYRFNASVVANFQEWAARVSLYS